MKKILFVFILQLYLTSHLIGSSVLFIKLDAMVLGKNYDATNGAGMLLKNNRGVKKVAYNFDRQKMAEWTSKFGSLTFNQIGKEFPQGGVNETGLAVEMLHLPNTQYPVSNKPTLSEFEWVQYVLDNYRTAADVALDINSIDINPISSSVHFLVADRGGRSFIVEFINGKSNIYSTTSEERIALTNSFYANSVNYYSENKDKVNWSSKSSLDRYAQLITKGSIPNNRYVGPMFKIMEESSQDTDVLKTQWTIIYDLDNFTISYKTAQDQSIKKVYINQFNFIANSQLYYRDINASNQDWKIFNEKINLDYLKQSVVANMLNNTTLNQHMVNPSNTAIDDVYPLHYKDLQLTFYVKKQEGYLFYKLFDGEDNFNQFVSERSGVIAANNDTLNLTIYSVKKGDYAVSCFHDLNDNGFQDKKILGLFKEPVAYSKQKRSPFSRVRYNDIKFSLKEEDILSIDIQ